MEGALVLSAASALVALLALVIERLAGYPDRLHAAVRHPVVWMGSLIAALDDRLNAPKAGGRANRLRGAAALAILIAATLIVTVPTALLLRALPGGLIVEAVLAASLLSQRSLREHVLAVADGLDAGLIAGRTAVAHIVGRDPKLLDESGVACGALESLAENASDGVAAPLIWLIVAGLPGIALYKAINTADSMIGHRSTRHRDFGWAAARLDDLVNLPASRATGLGFALAAALDHADRGRAALAAMTHDAARHRSPNAGWPEAALAGALGIRLGGPRSYGGRRVDLAWMGDGRQALTANDIRAGIALYDRWLNLTLGLAATWLVLRWSLS